LTAVSDSYARLAGVVSLVAVWHVTSMFSSEIVIASPYLSLVRAVEMLSDISFWDKHMFVTLYRVVVSLLIGSFAGFILGVFAGRYSVVRSFFEPFRRTLTTIPGIVAAVLAMLWFGLGSIMVIFLNSIFIIPVVYLNIAESISRCDKSYMEIAQVYALTNYQKLKNIFLPTVGGALKASLMVVTGNSMRLVVLGELLGAGDGLGYVLGISRARLDMPSLYGCVLICFIFVLSGEWIIKAALGRVLR